MTETDDRQKRNDPLRRGPVGPTDDRSQTLGDQKTAEHRCAALQKGGSERKGPPLFLLIYKCGRLSLWPLLARCIPIQTLHLSLQRPLKERLAGSCSLKPQWLFGFQPIQSMVRIRFGLVQH